MKFNVRVVIFNLRGILWVEVGVFLVKALKNLSATGRQEPESIQIFLEGGRELRREGKEGLIEFGGGRNSDNFVEIFESLRLLILVFHGFGEMRG